MARIVLERKIKQVLKPLPTPGCDAIKESMVGPDIRPPANNREQGAHEQNEPNASIDVTDGSAAPPFDVDFARFRTEASPVAPDGRPEPEVIFCDHTLSVRHRWQILAGSIFSKKLRTVKSSEPSEPHQRRKPCEQSESRARSRGRSMTGKMNERGPSQRRATV